MKGAEAMQCAKTGHNDDAVPGLRGYSLASCKH
jgi:hypothetical protein